MNNKAIMSGNEAVARGCMEAGCGFAAAYPGTPSTEILENMSQYKDIYCQWANNEKVAAEMAGGAAIGGMRALVAMKHVGMNVAADPMFSYAYAGVKGGLIFVTADDPGCHSSQNEQDNRLYAPHAKMPMFEPSDSQECKDFISAAFDISERFDLPVIFRMTTRICHSKSIVVLGEATAPVLKKYETDIGKYTLLPAVARVRHRVVSDQLAQLEDYAGKSHLNRIEYDKKKEIGIITSGISYQHAKEVFGENASYLKFGITYPLSRALIAEFCDSVDKVYVIEEGEPYLETAVAALGYKCIGKDKITDQGELTAGIVRTALTDIAPNEGYDQPGEAPPRPPVLCAGCPHRGFFYALGKYKDRIVAVGDIGCYALGIQTPFHGFDISICMGSGISAPLGLSKALAAQGDGRRVLGLLGDSTFFHSGVNSLIDVVHAKANVIACVLDNSITAMTGHQENAGTTHDLMGYEVPSVDVVALVEATGIDEDRIRIVDPLDIEAMTGAIDAALSREGPFVIVTKSPCALIKAVIKARGDLRCAIDAEKCIGCKACMKIACPSLAFKEKKAYISDPANCTGCGLCRQMCKFDAITKVGGLS
jgi:indolepyruvate ferredoxin oxidoreductase alpha subunit